MSGLLAAATTTIPGFSTSGGVTTCSPAGLCGSSPIVSSGSGVQVGGSSLDLTSLAGVLVEVLAVMSMAALVGIVIIAVVANRADPDPTGRRPQSVYYFVVSFVTITTSILGSALIVASILWLTASSSASHPIAQLLLASALLFAVSTGLFVIHLRRGLALARADSTVANPSHRVGQSYVSIVAFVSILVLLVTGVITIYLIFAVASPTTFGSFGGRSVSVRLLLESIYLALVAVVVLWSHSSLLVPRLGLFSRGTGPRAASSDGPGPVPPSMP